MPKERPKNAMPWEGMEALDDELLKLGRGAGALRLRLGEAMQTLFEAGGHRELGFPSFGTWATERIERSGRWADDSRAVARRLAELPKVREALRAGMISWSAAELLGRYGKESGEDELLEMGRALTVRQLREALKRLASDEAPADDGEDEDDAQQERCTLVLTVERSHAWAFETTRQLLDRLDGTKALDAVVEALLAEGMVALSPWLLDGSVPDDELGREWRQQLARWRREAVEVCERRIPREEPELLACRDEPLPSGVRELDAACRELSCQLAERDLVLGQLVLRLFEADGWRKLGYATESQYCRERLGLSWSSVKRRMSLARRTRRAPPVAEALESGEIGFEAACLLARVADNRNSAAWIDRARRRTIKFLRQEVDCVETLARVNGRRGRLDPPDEATLDAWFEAERRVKSGEVFGLGQMSGDHDRPIGAGQMSGDHDRPIGAGQMSGGPHLESLVAAISPDALMSQLSGDRDGRNDEPLGRLLRTGAGRVELRLSLREDLFRWWRALRHVHRRSGLPGPFVAFLVAEMWRVWGPELPSDVKWAHIYRRDRHECASPVCDRRDVTPHHLKFQSHGGGDEDANLVSLCAECHLFGVHEGRLSVSPPADVMVWRLGRTPVLEVRGRERVLAS